MFWEENAKPGGYASVQTLEAHEEDRSRASMELQRARTSKQKDLIEAL